MPQVTASNPSILPTCPFDCTVDLLKFVRRPALMRFEAWQEVMVWLARRIAELTQLSATEMLWATDRMVAGESLFSTAPRGQIGYGMLDVSHVPGELQKADAERGLIGKLWRELHRRWPRYATIVSNDMLPPKDASDGSEIL